MQEVLRITEVLAALWVLETVEGSFSSCDGGGERPGFGIWSVVCGGQM